MAKEPLLLKLKKLKKHDAELTIELERNEDILSAVAGSSPGPFVVGFAAETENLETNARTKLENKSLDMIAANRVGGPRGGFESADNALTLLWPGGRKELPMMPKRDLARHLAEMIAERYYGAIQK